MWRFAALLAIASGCGFSPTAVASDSAGADAAATDSPHTDANHAVPDAAPVACSVTANGALAAAGEIGGDGGNAEPALACHAGELPIGIQLDMSSGTISDHGGEVVAVATHVRCGAITRDPSGAMATAQADS